MIHNKNLYSMQCIVSHLFPTVIRRMNLSVEFEFGLRTWRYYATDIYVEVQYDYLVIKSLMRILEESSSARTRRTGNDIWIPQTPIQHPCDDISIFEDWGGYGMECIMSCCNDPCVGIIYHSTASQGIGNTFPNNYNSYHHWNKKTTFIIALLCWRGSNVELLSTLTNLSMVWLTGAVLYNP